MIVAEYLRRHRRGRPQGFTLMELMITIAVMAILAGVALPSFRELSMNMTVSSSTNDLVAALNTARSEAVKRGRDVAVISTNDDWTSGWCIKVDADDAECSAGVDPDEIASHGEMPTSYKLVGKAAGNGTSDDKIVFRGTGVLGGSATSFDFSVCRPTGDRAATESRWINVAAGGVIVSRRDSTSSPAGACS